MITKNPITDIELEERARPLLEAGWPLPAIATRFGVGEKRVKRVLGERPVIGSMDA